MEEKQVMTNHKLLMTNRKGISLTGILDVISFDLREILLETSEGMLTIKGNDLHINRLSVEKGEAAAQSRMEWWISQIPLPAEPVTVQTVCREKEIQIKAEGNILPIWSRNAWEYSVLSESRRNNPVKTIRKIRAVKQIWNQK